jgi:hypothetical protein
VGRPCPRHHPRRCNDAMAVFPGMQPAPCRLSGRRGNRDCCRRFECNRRVALTERRGARTGSRPVLLGDRAGCGASASAGWLCGRAGQLAVLGRTAGFVGGIYCTGPR